MTSKLTRIISAILIISALVVRPALCIENVPRMVEETKAVMGSALRIQIPISPLQGEAAARAAIYKAFKEVSLLDPGNVSMGYVIDRIVAVLKECGLNNAFVNSDDEIYSLGMKSDKEMWKAWIPHPTDKKKVFAILRLKDKAIATVRNNALSASVVADDTGSAEKLARDLLVQGADGLKSADERGLDALLIMKDGNKLKTGMSGAFKEQYGKAKKK